MRHATATVNSFCLRCATIECCDAASACQLVDVFLVLLDPGYTTTALACIRAAKRSLACGTVATRQANDSSVRIPADDACVAGAVLIVLLHSIAGEEWKALQDSIRLRLHHNCFALDWLREIWINSLRALSNALGIRAKFLPLLPSFFSIVHWLGCVFCSFSIRAAFRSVQH